MKEREAAVEVTLEKIWREVLGLDRARSGDNFLDLGGNSLQAGEIVWRIQHELGIDVPIDVVLTDGQFSDFVRSVLAADVTV